MAIESSTLVALASSCSSRSRTARALLIRSSRSRYSSVTSWASMSRLVTSPSFSMRASASWKRAAGTRTMMVKLLCLARKPPSSRAADSTAFNPGCTSNTAMVRLAV